jgi:hypothetical protein
MLDITAFTNALRAGSVSFVSALGAIPFSDDEGEVARIRGEDALVVPLGRPGDAHPWLTLRLPLEPGGGAAWPARYADLTAAAGAITAHLPTGVSILDIDEIRGTPVALIHDWVPGETLTARVTRSRERHARDRLGELLRPLADLAEALRLSGLVHGDIAPGNIIVRPGGEMTLIDLDRAGFRDGDPPVEPRRRTGYRLPRGGSSPEAEDAFALLVLMTSIAVMADASVPIEHEHAPEWTHPSLLFSSWDLMDLQRSRLVREIGDQLGARSRGLLDRLIAASIGNPDHAPGLLREAVRDIRRDGPGSVAGPAVFDDDELGWHLPGRPEERMAPVPLPDIDLGWPQPPETGGPASGWGAPATPDAPFSTTWPEAPAAPLEVEPAASIAGDPTSVAALVDGLRAMAMPDRDGPSRRRQRSETRRLRVGQRLHRALAENDRAVLVELAMSGDLAELGESDRQDVLQVVRALSYDAIARAIATDDDEAILASIDAGVFASDDELDPAFRDRVRLARQRASWTERVRLAARARDGRAGAELLREPPPGGVERLPEAVRRQLARLAEEQDAVEAANEAIRLRDANALAASLGRLVALRPVWTDLVEAADVVRLLGAGQIEGRLVARLASGELADSEQWLVDIVIAAGRLPEVTRLAGLTPRDVDRMIHRRIEDG